METYTSSELSEQRTGRRESVRKVQITGVEIPFVDMVSLMVKDALAVIPATLILGALALVGYALVVAIVTAP